MKALLFIIWFPLSLLAQRADSVITLQETTRIESALSSDSMGGRGLFTSGIEMAATFIAGELRSAGLRPMSGNDYRQSFQFSTARLLRAYGTVDGLPCTSERIVAFTDKPDLLITGTGDFYKVSIRQGDDFRTTARRLLKADSNFVVFVDTSFSASFAILASMQEQIRKKGTSTVFVLSSSDPKTYSLTIKKAIQTHTLSNVVAVLPGRTLPDEFVLFSAHYDHLGTGQADSSGDAIFNGANDDASGTTAVLLLARYFAEKKDNARTLVFAAFTGEESGGLGSTEFARHIDPASVKAMFNIEMIGTESKWGTGSAYITGYERSDMGSILQKNLSGSAFHFYPDPYPDQQLFFRSDNASLAKLGVPAHTISTSKMDTEKYYHTQKDELKTLDLVNMTAIIRSIALSAGSITGGKSTPARIRMDP